MIFKEIDKIKDSNIANEFKLSLYVNSKRKYFENMAREIVSSLMGYRSIYSVVLDNYIEDLVSDVIAKLIEKEASFESYSSNYEELDESSKDAVVHEYIKNMVFASKYNEYYKVKSEGYELKHLEDKISTDEDKNSTIESIISCNEDKIDDVENLVSYKQAVEECKEVFYANRLTKSNITFEEWINSIVMSVEYCTDNIFTDKNAIDNAIRYKKDFLENLRIVVKVGIKYGVKLNGDI